MTKVNWDVIRAAAVEIRDADAFNFKRPTPTKGSAVEHDPDTDAKLLSTIQAMIRSGKIAGSGSGQSSKAGANVLGRAYERKTGDAITSRGILARVGSNMETTASVGATYRDIRLRAERRGFSAVVTPTGVLVSNGIKSATINTMETLEAFTGTMDAAASRPALREALQRYSAAGKERTPEYKAAYKVYHGVGHGPNGASEDDHAKALSALRFRGVGTDAASVNDDPCQTGYEQAGMKNKDGRQVPNCIPTEDAGAILAAFIDEFSPEAREARKKDQKAKVKIDLKGSAKHISETSKKTDSFIKKVHEKLHKDAATVDALTPGQRRTAKAGSDDFYTGPGNPAGAMRNWKITGTSGGKTTSKIVQARNHNEASVKAAKEAPIMLAHSIVLQDAATVDAAWAVTAVRVR